MPTNLNALIRYKEIDKCLSNPYTRCTIDKLRDVCSDALKESKGFDRRISERTIRDDIRVMRSDILGFNAPIVFVDGYYKYGIPFFSLFNRLVPYEEILLEVFYFIKKDGKNTKEEDDILEKIASVLGRPIEAIDGAAYSQIRPEHYMNMDPVFIEEMFKIPFKDESAYKRKLSIYDPIVIDWGDILSVLN